MQRFVVLAAVVASACGGAEPTGKGPAPVAGVTTDPSAFAEQLRKAAAPYASWGKVDAQVNLAPALCAAPTPPGSADSAIRLSAADDGSPHAQKLYYLFASDRARYVGLGAGAAALPVGFTVVKQSFAPRTSAERPALDQSWVQAPDGTYLTPDQPKDLFVMTKVADGAADGTDAGWIYGTIAVDGTVTSAGRVATCMGCHVDQAQHERLFGPR